MASKRRKRRKRTNQKSPGKARYRMSRQDLLVVLAILFATAVMFGRTAGYDFVNWDDDFNIAKNPNLRYLDWANIKGIFSSHVIGNYNPLTIFTFALEKHFFGLDPTVFHINNVLLHLLCVFLVFRLCRQLGLPLWGATIAAALFGLHPMRIESVAWITERKDVLYSVFYLAALGQYVSWLKHKRKSRRHVLWITIFFVFSLFSKIQAVALPLSMLCIDFLLRRPLRWRLLLEKWHYFALSLAFGLIGVVFLSEQGSLDSSQHFTLFERIFVGIYSFVLYLIKFVVPFRVSPLYPYPGSLHWYMYASVVPFMAILWFFWYAFRRRGKWRPIVFGLAFFTFNVMFVLQVVGAGQGFIADRFTYIPYLGLMFAAGYYLERALRKATQWRSAVLAAIIIWGLGLCVQTWRHVPIWENSGTLWTHVLKHYKKTALPFRNRAQFYREQGEFNKALQDYNRSIALKADPDVINSRARLYFTQQKWQQALQDYDRAIELDPTVGEYWINRGAAYAMMGNMPDALSNMNEGLRLDPDFLNGYSNRSLVYQRLGQYEKAHQDILTYLNMNPYSADMWYESARLYRRKNDERSALEALNRAISLDSGKGVFYFERSKTHLTLGNKAQAQRDLARAESMGVQVDAQTKALYR